MRALLTCLALLAVELPSHGQMVGWTPEQFVQKYPDTWTTKDMGEICYHSTSSGVAIVAWLDKGKTFIHRLTFRGSSVLPKSYVQNLLKLNGPDLTWKITKQGGGEVDLEGTKDDKLVIGATWTDEGISIFAFDAFKPPATEVVTASTPVAQKEVPAMQQVAKEPVANPTLTPSVPHENGGLGVFLLLIVCVLAFGFYFLPTINAARKKHHNCAAIFLVNLLFGWTFFGWVIALIWSATKPPPPAPPPQQAVVQSV
jgi:Superinfection immunity protein